MHGEFLIHALRAGMNCFERPACLAKNPIEYSTAPSDGTQFPVIRISCERVKKVNHPVFIDIYAIFPKISAPQTKKNPCIFLVKDGNEKRMKVTTR